MVDEDLRVALAQLNGRLDALQQTVELRVWNESGGSREGDVSWFAVETL